MAAPVELKHVMIEIHKSRPRAIAMEQKQKKSISHSADEEHLSGEACWSESGAKTQALFSLFLIKKYFSPFIW